LYWDPESCGRSPVADNNSRVGCVYQNGYLTIDDISEMRYLWPMMRNRSVPSNSVLPHIVYQNLARAIAWLTEKFGFTEHYRYGEPLSGAQVHLGDAWIMLKAARAGHLTPTELGYRTQTLTVFVDDVDAHYARAKAAGAKIIEELHETIYGERQYGAMDLDGHHWLFSQHARDLSPDEWGAVIKNAYPAD
jgi:uncharacterized glyoxalase superfamily protein PhnB